MIVGLIMIAVPSIAIVKYGRMEMVVILPLGLIFIVYGVGGNRLIRKVKYLSKYGKDIGEK